MLRMAQLLFSMGTKISIYLASVVAFWLVGFGFFRVWFLFFWLVGLVWLFLFWGFSVWWGVGVGFCFMFFLK